MTSQIPLLQNFPVDGSRRMLGAPSLDRARERIRLSGLTAFERLCLSEDVDLFAGLHAALALLFARCSGEHDILLDTPTLGVLHASVSCAQTFRCLLTQSRDLIREAQTRSVVPGMNDSIEAGGIEHGKLLFQLHLMEREGRNSDPVTEVSGDLAVCVPRTAAGLFLEWFYASDLLSARTVRRMARRLEVLIDAVVRNPDADLWRIPLLDSAERQQILVEWNDTSAPFHQRTLHELFAAQAVRTPDAIALDCRGAQLSYRELNERANRLAHYLRKQGVTTQSLVGVCLERSPEMVAGLLAILKAGGAYVPLDPQYPRERLEFMLADSGARWVLTQSQTLALFDEHVSRIIVDAPDFLEALQCCSPSDPQPLSGRGTDALAYVIYTSGSTGRPKGVCIEHRQAAAFIGWAQSVYDATALDGVLAATSICFDLSVFELFVPLSSGGRVVMVDHPLDFEGIANAPALCLINTVPSAVKALLEERAIPSSVKIINLCGEPLPETLVRDIYRNTAVEAVYNLYGPSEDTTYSTYALIGRDGQGAPPIGKPISNGQVYVLDNYLEPVPIGVVGEIHVGGAGVARGYWERPELTAERFMPDPFRNVAGARLYRTGDLARWSADEALEFLGRVDHQVKLRGFRIELGEIQSRLLDMEVVNDAVVTVRDDERGDKQLIAYVVPVDSAVSQSELSHACKSHLAEQLPAYMIPAAFVALGALPLTPNGKIDRAALPAPLLDSAQDYVAPSSELQMRLAQLWQEVLRLPTAVSMTANFFDLGGHSILAMRLLARLRQEHHVVIPLHSLFSAATLADFARLVAQGGEKALPLGPLRDVSQQTPLPLSFTQQGLWLIDQLEGSSAQYHIQLRFLLVGSLDIRALRNAIEAITQRHDSLRTVIELHEQQPVQRILDVAAIPFAQVDLSALSPTAQVTEVERIVRLDALAPFALDRDSMLRMALVRLESTRYELLLTLHHIATDGWSLDVLVAELGRLYEAELLGREPVLPPLSFRYADYAVWQRAWLQSEEFEEHTQYWLRQLSDLPATHGLPLDRPRQPQQGRAGARLRTHVNSTATRALKELCREERATLFMSLHAVFSILMARYSGEEDIVVGTPVANRQQAEFAPLIGMFTNTVVLRSDVPAASTFIELVRQSRQAMLGAYAHQQVPFESLVERINPERSLSYMPLFQVMLSLQDTGQAPLELSGVAVTARPAHIELSLAELTLEVSEIAGELQLDWIYRRELFDASTIKQMAQHFDDLLKGAVAQPGLDVWTLPILDATKHHRIAHQPSRRRDDQPRLHTRRGEISGAGPSESSAKRTFAMPQTAVEKGLHEIWSRLLQRDAVDIDMNFFAAGGNSLLLMRMIHGVREKLGARVQVKDVFEQPTIRRLASALGAHADIADAPPSQSQRDGKSALSLCQFRVWYVEQVRSSNQHNIPIVVALRGSLEALILEQALNLMIARHDMLRTGFILEQDAPMQVTQASRTLTLQHRDLAALEPAEIAASASVLGAEHATRRFDIQQPPLFSALLIRVAATEYRLHLNFHHLIFDGWSFAIFFDELIAVYEAVAGGLEPELPALPHRYADFVSWQWSWLGSEEARAQAAFWRAYLQGCPEPLTLSGHGGWKKDAEDSSTRICARMPASAREHVQRLARDMRGTPFTVLYSTFALLLGRLAGQLDLTIGIPVSGRHVPETQGVIGNFLNNLPVRTHWQPQQAFDDYLAAQIRNVEQVLSNQEYPFEKILEQAPHLRGIQGTPIFQVFFNMLSVPRSTRPRLFEAEMADGAETEPKFDLTLYVVDDGAEITLTCHYKRSLFSSAGMAHLLRQYLFLLEQVVENAQLPCGQYSLRPETPEEGPLNLEPKRYWLGAVQQIFREQALERPQALAIVEPGQQWSYRELLSASDKLAKTLQQQGVGRGDVVAIVAARRACLVVGVMAVLQTGAAFSLLNPEYPVDRVCLLVGIVKPACVIFAGERSLFPAPLAERLEAMSTCTYLPVVKRPRFDAEQDDFVPASVEPEQLACVTFTSGTTGIPKAVAGTHIGMAGYLAWVPRWLQLSRHDRFSLLSGLGHDPLQRDLFSSLCIGATLVIPGPEVIAPHSLAQWLVSNAITFVHMTPAMAEILCTTDARRFPSLRVAFITGDKLSSGTVTKLLSYNSSMRVLNSYGTTETQRATTYLEASSASVQGSLVPVSESSADTVIRVLNAVGTSCGLSEEGEIFVESYALSRGYRNDPQLTSEVLSELGDGRRRYRTGDVGCRLPGGIVMLLGRKDSQIKVRGFRVETGEIEAHARSLDGVKEAAVVPFQRPGGEPVLVAYVVPARHATDDRKLRADILEHLRATLPPYMVPAAVVAISHLPLTPNGKLDQRALPEPMWDDAVGSVSPRTDLEHAMASIWAEVLGLERVGVDDDFFALGGHSMLMVLLFNRIRERLGLRVNIGKIISCSTVAEQAQVLSGMASNTAARLAS